MKSLVLLLNCMLCLLPVMANGASLSKVRTTPTKAQLLTCRALLSHVDQDNAAARTLLRLLDYGLKTSAPDGGALLSSVELAELLKSDKPVNPKRSPNNSIERNYYISLKKAVEALKETQWSYVKSEVAKVLKIENEIDEVVGESQAQSDVFFSGTLLADRRYVHGKHISTYKDRSGRSFLIFIDNYNMSLIVARDEHDFRTAKIHEQEIKGQQHLDFPVNPVFYESNDGTVILVVASLDSILLYPISENGFGESRGKVVLKSPRPKDSAPSRFGDIEENVTAFGLYKDGEGKTALIVQSRLRKPGLGFDIETHYSRINIEEHLTTNSSEAEWLAKSDRSLEYRLERLTVVSSSQDQLILKQPLTNLVTDTSVSPSKSVNKRFLQTIDINLRNGTVATKDHEYAFGGLETDELMAHSQLPSGEYIFARTVGEKFLTFELEIYVAPALRLDSNSQLRMKTKVAGNNMIAMNFHEFANGHITLLVQGVSDNVELYSLQGSFLKLWGKQHE